MIVLIGTDSFGGFVKEVGLYSTQEQAALYVNQHLSRGILYSIWTPELDAATAKAKAIGFTGRTRSERAS
jgi:hypothetical protein